MYRFACILAGLASALMALGAAAEEGPIEEIIVTGSYLRGSAEDAPSPITTLQRDEIVASGVSDVGELALNLEVASGSDTAPSDGARFNGTAGSGLANISLRGLGPTSTLVLLDGKRLPFAGQKISNGDRQALAIEEHHRRRRSSSCGPDRADSDDHEPQTHLPLLASPWSRS